MRAAVLREVNAPLTIEDVQVSAPAAREVLIRTVATGICHSDLHFQQGSFPFELPTVLGHEAAGVVERVGMNVAYVRPRDHVITCLSAFCGQCEHCLTGHLVRCSETTLDREKNQEPRLFQRGNEIHQFLNVSGFAEYMLVHEHALVKIRPDMPLDRAALIGCAVTTGVGAVVHTAAVEFGSSVAVIGCGGVGLSCINGAALVGAGQIIAIDTVESKLRLAKKFGATDTINASNTDPVDAVRDLTTDGVHYSFEAIGLKSTTEQAWNMLRPGGCATVIGLIPEGTMISIHGIDLIQEKKLQGSLMGSNRFRVDMPRLVEFYLSGKLNLDDLISSHVELEHINDCFAQLRSGEVTRNVIMFE